LTSRPRQIGLVIGQLGFGGAEGQLTELALGLSAAEDRPTVYCLSPIVEPFGRRLKAGGITVRVIPRIGAFDLARAVRLAFAFRRDGIDAVQSYLIDSNPYALLAARLAGIHPFGAANRNAYVARDGVRAALDGIAFRRASAVVVNAIAVREFTARRFSVPLDRFRVIYNGVDLRRFRRAERSGSTLRIGTAGSLTSKKNPQMFVEVATALAQRFGHLECLHAGDGPLRTCLGSAVGEGARATVRFLGNVPEIGSFLQRLDVFLLTSDHEGCPNVLLEAMACGVPVVTTDAGGAAEIVRDGLTGHVVPRRAAGEMVDRASELLQDSHLREQMGRAARADVEERFPIERMITETREVLRAVALERR
jgi:glycosyltransferase involved in cell wall biosynthesis